MTSPLSGGADTGGSGGTGSPFLKIDTSRPHPARMYDYFLGGKDHYEVDRDAAEQFIKAAPEVVTKAQPSRSWLMVWMRSRSHG